MSDDDWENQLNSDDDAETTKKEEEKKAEEAKKWDETKIDTEKLKEQKLAEKKAAEEKRQAEARIKNKDALFDPDAAFKKRQEQYGGSTTAKAEDTKGMSEAAKAIFLEKQAEYNNIDQLFAGEPTEATPTVVKLNDQKDYIKYGEQTAKTLYGGAAPYRIENFMKELCKGLKDNCDAQQIKKILDNITLIHKEKDKEERKNKGGGGKKGGGLASATGAAGGDAKAALKGGGGKGYDRNNNSQMVADNIGGGDYGDYGDEAEGAFKREGEVEHDFM